MAVQKFLVKEGYAYLHLNNLGVMMKRAPAGSIVELPDIDYGKQAWKLEPVVGEVQAPPNDLALIEGANASLLEFFDEKEITTFRGVAALSIESVMEVKGFKKDKAEKVLRSAFELAGMG